MELVQKQFVKHEPAAAVRSIVGVWSMRLPRRKWRGRGDRRPLYRGCSAADERARLDEQDRVVRQEPGFDKNALNEIAAMFGHAAVASPYDGAPASKPGCSSRHLEAQTGDAGAEALDLHSKPGREASVIELEEDPVEY